MDRQIRLPTRMVTGVISKSANGRFASSLTAKSARPLSRIDALFQADRGREAARAKDPGAPFARPSLTRLLRVRPSSPDAFSCVRNQRFRLLSFSRARY